MFMHVCMYRCVCVCVHPHVPVAVICCLLCCICCVLVSYQRPETIPCMCKSDSDYHSDVCDYTVQFI